jgi:hypothetical protein
MTAVISFFNSDDDDAAMNQKVVNDLHDNMRDMSCVEQFPSNIRWLLEQRTWERPRRFEKMAVYPPCSLHDLICKPYPEGIGVTFETVERLIKPHPEVFALWTEATKRPAGGANNPAGLGGKSGKTEDDIVNLDIVQDDKVALPKAPTGNSAAAGLRKLQKAAAEGNAKAQEELAAVIAGEKKVTPACVAAGLRKPTRIDPDVRKRCDRANAERAVEHLPHETLEAFVSDLFAAGHKTLAIEIKNLIGESIMDRNFGARQ